MNNQFGIDRMVQDKVDAYRGQPEQLMRSYQNNQQLIDLLALQKIKTEKEAAARQMQLDMASKLGTPQTVAQQREKEVLDLTRNEIAGQSAVGGQQMAAQQAQEQGIAGQPAPNMQQFADGGIVGFSGEEGSFVRRRPTKQQLEEAEQRRAASRGSRAGVRPPDATWGLAELGEFLTLPEDIVQATPGRGGRAFPAPEPEVAQPEIDPLELEGPIQAMLGEDVLPYEQPAAAVAAPPPSTETQGIAAALPQPTAPAAPDRVAPTVYQTDPRLERATTSALDANTPEGIAAAKRAASEDYNRNMQSPEIQAAQAKRQSIQDQLEAQYAQMNNPSRQRMERLSAFLRGGANNTGGIGSVLAGAGAGMAGERAQQDAQRVAQMEKLQTYYNARVVELQQLGLGRQQAEQQAGKEVTEAVNAAMGTAGNINVAQNRAVMDAAQLEATQRGQDIQAATSRYSTDVQAADNAAQRASTERMSEERITGAVTRALQEAGVEMTKADQEMAAELFTQYQMDPRVMEEAEETGMAVEQVIALKVMETMRLIKGAASADSGQNSTGPQVNPTGRIIPR